MRPATTIPSDVQIRSPDAIPISDLARRPVVSPGDLRIDAESCRAYWRGVMVPLTMSEFKAVKLLGERPGIDVAYARIGANAFGTPDGGHRPVSSHFKRIRKKFLAIDPSFDAIKVYYGFGYRWDGPRAKPLTLQRCPNCGHCLEAAQ